MTDVNTDSPADLQAEPLQAMSGRDGKSLIAVEEITERLIPADLVDLCDATGTAITDGGGFGWISPPPPETLERFWSGVVAMPGRTLFVGRLDGVVCGSAQLLRPHRNNEAQAHTATLISAFVAPWARAHGISAALAAAVEQKARAEGFEFLSLDVRETQSRAIQVFQRRGYRRWGINPCYAQVGDKMIAGYHYLKALTPAAEQRLARLLPERDGR
jgi:ribosomal protein S18 acetylase RimI-like enzyme